MKWHAQIANARGQETPIFSDAQASPSPEASSPALPIEIPGWQSRLGKMDKCPFGDRLEVRHCPFGLSRLLFCWCRAFFCKTKIPHPLSHSSPPTPPGPSAPAQDYLGPASPAHPITSTQGQPAYIQTRHPPERKPSLPALHSLTISSSTKPNIRTTTPTSLFHPQYNYSTASTLRASSSTFPSIYHQPLPSPHSFNACHRCYRLRYAIRLNPTKILLQHQLSAHPSTATKQAVYFNSTLPRPLSESIASISQQSCLRTYNRSCNRAEPNIMPSRLDAPVLTVDVGLIHKVDTRNAENLFSMWTGEQIPGIGVRKKY